MKIRKKRLESKVSNIKSVCVYCGSSNNVNKDYLKAAIDMGAELGKNEMRLVYGGGNVGLMGACANATLENGGEVHGIIPSHIAEKEVQHNHLTKLDVVETMHERKQLMVDHSDAFVVLPGGLGTMDEFFEIMTWRQLGLHDKPILVANINGYWDHLLSLIDGLIKEGFARQTDRDFLLVVDKVEDIVAALQAAPRETVDPQSKWI
jgi:uncharacterized protein (TIGR00730 family)